MIDLLGFLYAIAKDIKEYLEWKEEDKEVDATWVEKSGLQEKADSNGLTLRWSTIEKLASRQLDGYEVVYEIDKENKIRRRLLRRGEMVLIGKPTTK